MRKIADETPDRLQLEERFFARQIARAELEERAARAFLSGVLSPVMRALVTVASGRDASYQDRFDAWDAARALGEQLLTFCARRGIQPTEWPKEATFVSLLRDRDKAALIEELWQSGVMLGKQKLRLLQRDASAVLGVNEDYTSTVRHREKHPVKKTGRRRR